MYKTRLGGCTQGRLALAASHAQLFADLYSFFSFKEFLFLQCQEEHVVNEGEKLMSCKDFLLRFLLFS